MSFRYLNHGIRAIVSVRPKNGRLLLLELAEGEFAAVGFEAASVSSIAALAGVSQQAIYRMFGGKAGLRDAVQAARATVSLPASEAAPAVRSNITQ